MKKVRRGFTLVEVSLFLAITALVFVGITVGTQNSIFQQRYNDSVQNFAEFLRTVYSQVKNVKNVKDGGKSEKAIYGKLVTFGEKFNLEGNANNDGAIFSYDVIGKAENFTSVSIDRLELSVLDDNGKFAGNPESYVPRWGAKIQTTAGWSGSGYEPFEGALLVFRNPSTGILDTKFTNTVIEINNLKKNDNRLEIKEKLKGIINSTQSEPVDFCVNPNGNEENSLRRDVRLKIGLGSVSNVEVVADNDSECGQ